MTEKIILYAIIGIAVSTALAFLTKATGKSVDIDESGQFNLRMNKLYGIMGIIGLVFGLLFLIFHLWRNSLKQSYYHQPHY